MKKKLLIIGAGGHGKVVADVAMKMNKWDEIAFLDDNLKIIEPLDLNIIGTTKDILTYINDYDFFVGIGNNEIRKDLQIELEKLGATIPVLIHPTAVVGKDVYIKEGTVIMAGVVINCSTTIGRGCIINTGVTVDHDNKIGEFVHISPGVNLAGNVKIGNNSWIGIGSSISNNITISENCIVGAGGVVIKDIKKPGTYVGIPVELKK